jgi:hypothetical protein
MATNMEVILDILKVLNADYPNGFPSVELYHMAEDKGMDIEDAAGEIYKLIYDTRTIKTHKHGIYTLT